MSIEDRLRERLLKAERLIFGAAMGRLKAKLAESARQD